MADGLTLRDRFALAFIRGAHASANAWLAPKALAEHAYQVADAMIAARVEREDGNGGEGTPEPGDVGHGGHG